MAIHIPENDATAKHSISGCLKVTTHLPVPVAVTSPTDQDREWRESIWSLGSSSGEREETESVLLSGSIQSDPSPKTAASETDESVQLRVISIKQKSSSLKSPLLEKCPPWVNPFDENVQRRRKLMSRISDPCPSNNTNRQFFGLDCYELMRRNSLPMRYNMRRLHERARQLQTGGRDFHPDSWNLLSPECPRSDAHCSVEASAESARIEFPTQSSPESLRMKPPRPPTCSITQAVGETEAAIVVVPGRVADIVNRVEASLQETPRAVGFSKHRMHGAGQDQHLGRSVSANSTNQYAFEALVNKPKQSRVNSENHHNDRSPPVPARRSIQPGDRFPSKKAASGHGPSDNGVLRNLTSERYPKTNRNAVHHSLAPEIENQLSNDLNFLKIVPIQNAPSSEPLSPDGVNTSTGWQHTNASNWSEPNVKKKIRRKVQSRHSTDSRHPLQQPDVAQSMATHSSCSPISLQLFHTAEAPLQAMGDRTSPFLPPASSDEVRDLPHHWVKKSCTFPASTTRRKRRSPSPPRLIECPRSTDCLNQLSPPFVPSVRLFDIVRFARLSSVFLPRHLVLMWLMESPKRSSLQLHVRSKQLCIPETWTHSIPTYDHQPSGPVPTVCAHTNSVFKPVTPTNQSGKPSVLVIETVAGFDGLCENQIIVELDGVSILSTGSQNKQSIFKRLVRDKASRWGGEDTGICLVVATPNSHLVRTRDGGLVVPDTSEVEEVFRINRQLFPVVQPRHDRLKFRPKGQMVMESCNLKPLSEKLLNFAYSSCAAEGSQAVCRPDNDLSNLL